MKTKKKVLVAFDGSKASMEAVFYLSKLSCLSDERVVLFHVFSPLPDYYWDMEGYSDPVLYGQRLREVVSWERESRATIQSQLEKAKSILTDAGYRSSAVKIKIVDRQNGFARDIINETRDGYHLFFIGRKGRSNLAPFEYGGVTNKLMQKIDFIPVVLVGESPTSKKALIALDGSACASRALSTIGTLLLKSKFGVTLIHVTRGEGPEEFLTTASKWGKAIIASAKKELTEDQVKNKILSGERSRAEAIIHEAHQQGYGTIVIGRKGLSDVRQFYMGMVCRKITHLAVNHAVWICN